MNRDQLEQLWDDRRDGTLGDEQTRAFDDAVRRDPALRAMWDAESQWLDVLAANESASDDAFAGDVVARWRREQDQPVVGRVDGQRAGQIWYAVGSAMAAALLIVAAWAGYQNNQPPTTPPAIVKAPADTDTPDPVGALMRNIDEQVAEQPAKIRKVVSDTAALLDVKRVFSLLEVPVPDPAEYVEPTEQKG